jgi:hypothetical protein
MPGESIVNANLRVHIAMAVLAALVALPAAAAPKKAKPACEEGKILVRHACVTPCATKGTFTDPAACECPPGYGKILHGDGGGECRPLACPVNKEFETKSCECPEGKIKRATSKGKAKCVAPRRKA